MQDDLAHKIASACLDHIQARPDTPSVDELADVVRPLLQIQHAPPYDERADAAGLYDPPSPSTQELYDARPFINAEVPFQLINGRRCITEEQVVKDEDIANFVSRYLRFFEHDPITGAYFFRERTPKTPEAGDGE